MNEIVYCRRNAKLNCAIKVAVVLSVIRVVMRRRSTVIRY